MTMTPDDPPAAEPSAAEPAPQPGHRASGDIATRAQTALKWSLVSQVVARGGAFAIGLILARLLVPEEYGTYTVALGLFTILLTVDDLGLRQGLVRHVGDTVAADRTAATIASITGIASYAIAFIAAPLVADITNTPDVTAIVRVLCLGLLIDTIFHIVPSAALQRTFRQDLFAITELGGLAIDFAITIVLAKQGHGAWSLVWGSLAGQVVRAVLSIVLTRTRPTWGYQREVARELLAVSAPFALASLVGAALLNIDYLIVGHILGPAAVGAYLIAFNVSSWPISLVGTAVRAVAVPGFAQLRAGGGEVAQAFCRGQVLLAAAGLPFAVLLTTAPETVITGLYGAEWAAGADALRLMGGLAIVRLLGGLVEDLLLAVGHSRWILWKNVAWIVALGPALWIGASTHDLAGVGLAQSLVACVVVAPITVVMVRRVGAFRGSQLRTIPLLLPGAVAAGVAGVLLGRALDLHPLLTATLVGVLELAVYAASLVPLRSTLRAQASA